MRHCNTCEANLPLELFGIVRKNGKEYRRGECNPCLALKAKSRHKAKVSNVDYKSKRRAAIEKWKINNPDKTYMHNRRAQWKSRGIDPDKAQAYYEAHNGLCDLCREPANATAFHVDHCHKTGKIRGMLHAECNALLGFAKDSPYRLILAIDYLNKHN